MLTTATEGPSANTESVSAASYGADTTRDAPALTAIRSEDAGARRAASAAALNLLATLDAAVTKKRSVDQMICMLQHETRRERQRRRRRLLLGVLTVGPMVAIVSD